MFFQNKRRAGSPLFFPLSQVQALFLNLGHPANAEKKDKKMLKMSLRIQYISHGSFLSTIFYSICTPAPALQPYRQGSLVLLDIYKVPHHISPKKKRAAHLPIFCLCDDRFFAIGTQALPLCPPLSRPAPLPSPQAALALAKNVFLFYWLYKNYFSFGGFFSIFISPSILRRRAMPPFLFFCLPACPLLFAKTPPGSNFPFFYTPRFCQKAQISLPS